MRGSHIERTQHKVLMSCRELFPFLVAALRYISEFIHSRPQDLVFLPNVTTALNTVLHNTTLERGDEVLMLDMGYGSTKRICRSRCDITGAKLVLAAVPLPLADGCVPLWCISPTIFPQLWPESTELN